MQQLQEIRNCLTTAALQGWRRGIPPPSRKFAFNVGLLEWMIGTTVLGCVLAFAAFIFQSITNIGNKDLPYAVYFFTVLIMWLSPWLIGLYGLRYTFPRALRAHSPWHNFSFSQRWLSHAVLGLALACTVTSFLAHPFAKAWKETIIPTISKIEPEANKWLSMFDSILEKKKKTKELAWGNPLKLLTGKQFFWVWFPSILVFAFLARFLFYTNPSLGSKKNKKHIKGTLPLPFGLWLGQSTGMLAARYHKAAISTGNQIAVFEDDAAQNILVLGAIGSGKTTNAMHPFLLQLLDQHCGGLIFDIKGDFKNSVESLSTLTNRSYSIIGTQAACINLLAGLSPEVASSFLKSAFFLSTNKMDSFWIDTATELCKNALGVLTFLPQHYSLFGLYQYLFTPDFKIKCEEQLELLLLEEGQKRLLSTYQHYDECVFAHFDDKVKAGVRATIAQVLSPFYHPALIDTFCTASSKEIDLKALLDGEIILVDLPLAEWGLGGKVVYTFIKLRFFQLMRQRLLNPKWNQSRYIFFLCDEYQEIVNANKEGLSDLNFWDKSRSSKTIGIISAQSVSSFYAAIGERDLTHALLQNFRQKLCFRTEDRATIELLGHLLGTTEIERVSFSKSSSKSTSLADYNSSNSESQTYSTHDKAVVDGQFFRELKANHALALLSLNGHGADDVIKTTPVFI